MTSSRKMADLWSFGAILRSLNNEILENDPIFIIYFSKTIPLACSFLGDLYKKWHGESYSKLEFCLCQQGYCRVEGLILLRMIVLTVFRSMTFSPKKGSTSLILS